LKTTKWPFIVERRQYPIKICYAMTINKSLRADITKSWYLLKKPVFSRGQLYVTLSPVTSKAGLKILIEDEGGNCSNETKNIVYREVFSRLNT
jgi:ATP-dependent DNA helicase PIF1